MNFCRGGPGGSWRLQPFNEPSPKFFFTVAPCWFHRLMQRWILGFKWTRE